ncbi:MAG: TIGR02147 family protein [Chitinivibrionales bacterium]|nr:TIGR02147 family protein [Chitinivibrionales bacterium]
MIPSIYKYLDYRQYLTDTFITLKGIRPSFSYRSFSRMAESTSPNFFKQITSRKLNISLTQVKALSHALSLNESELHYFETIVSFDHAKTHEEKDKYFQRILIAREVYSPKILEKQQYEYLSHWYYPVIRELVTHSLYPDDPTWIATQIIPQITSSKVKKAIQLLETLNLIVRKEDQSGWKLVDTTIGTPAQVISMAVIAYHKNMIMRALESIERFDATSRDIRALTIGTSEEGFQILKKRMEAFWKELSVFAGNQQCIDIVAQINLQLFPIAIIKKEKKK